MRMLLIACWLSGALGFWGVSYDEMCKKGGGWGEVIVSAVASAGWPLVIAARLGVAAWSPSTAVRALGCGTRESAPQKQEG
jgi:hypothetical protein